MGTEPPDLQLDGANWHTTAFARRIREDTLAHRTRTVFDIVLHPPGPGLETQWHSVLGMDVAMQDPDDQGLSPANRTLTKVVMAVLPLTDPNMRWKSPEEAAEVLEQMFPAMLQRTVHWKEPTGDAALVLFVTQGLGAHLLTRSADGFEVDLQWMEECAVREPFHRFGARLRLTPDLALRDIRVGTETHEPSDGAAWERAKLIFRSSVMAECTVVEHALYCHFIVNNCAIVATRRRLSPSHPLRRLMMPFHYRGPTINRDASVVNVGWRAIFHRLFGFTWEGLTRVYELAKEKYVQETFPENLARRGVADLDRYAFGSDGLLYWNSVRSFVSRYFDTAGLGDDVVASPDVAGWLVEWQKVTPARLEVTSKDALIDLCAHQIFNSTAFHEHTGGALGDYLYHLAFAPPVLRNAQQFDDMLPSRNTTIQGHMLAVVTNFAMPKLLEDWSILMLTHELQTLVRTWHGELHGLSDRIDELDTKRQQVPTFNPRNLELSVSI